MAAAARLGALVAIACAVAVAHGHVAHPATGSHVHPDVHELLGHDGHHAPHTFACGVGDPRLEEHFAKDEPGDVRQNYHDAAHPAVKRHLTEHGARGTLGPEMRKLARRMQLSQDYATASGGGFITAGEAHEAGITEGIRILPVWDAIDNGDDDRECHADDVGSTIPNLVTGTHVCAEEDVVTTELREMLEVRTDYAAEYFGEALKIKPVLDDITVLAGLVSEFNLDEDTYEDVDLIMIMTARPAAGLNGYARCRQFDQYGRCTVGEFNWVPTVLDPSKINEPDAIGAQRHTALHEMVHVLGGIGPSRVFRTETGAEVPFGDLWVLGDESEAYPKKVTKCKSPKVLAWAREHFGCEELDGLTIEDQPTGKVAHWEARLLGPELMSYGTGTGETIFGDVTFAYLEDTNQYVANYSRAGRMIDTQGDSGKQMEYKVDLDRPEGFVAPWTRPPGFLYWGFKQGCEFVQGSGGEWSDTYFCNKNRDFDCTHDHRMSAVCSVSTGWSFPNDIFSCGHCPSVGCSPTCTETRNDNPLAGGGYGLPTMFQYFDQAGANAAMGGAVVAGQTGGFSSALDFVPVRLGYWNCQDTKASNGTSGGGNTGGDSVDFGSLLGGATDNMKLFGGQAYCPSCRCMKSSLKDFSSGSVNTNFPTYGLCYRTNCPTAATLQFAIESQTGGKTTWYGCPPNGGKLYIAGFSGSIRCPIAEDFCKFEQVTGIKYSETDPFLEWIFFGTLFTMPLLIALCCLVPCCRNFWIGRCKKYCGVNHFTKEGVLDLDAEIDAHTKETAPPAGPAKVLKCVNGFIFFLALIALLLTVAGLGTGKNGPSIAAFMLAGLSLSTMLFAFMGFMAGHDKARGVSCAPIIYLFIVFFAFVFWIFAALYAMAFPEALGKTLDRQWPTIRDSFPEGVLPATLSDGKASDVLADNAPMVAGFYIVLGLCLLLQLGAVIKIVTLPVLAASLYTVCNWVLLGFGVGLWGAAGYASTLADSLPEISGVVGGLGFMGFYFVATSIFAIVASHKKTVKWLGAAMGITVLSVILTLALATAVFLATGSVDEILANVADDDLARATAALGLQNGSREDIAEGVRNNIRTLGLFGICVILMMGTMLVANAYFLHKVRKYWEKQSIKPAGGRRVTPQNELV